MTDQPKFTPKKEWQEKQHSLEKQDFKIEETNRKIILYENRYKLCAIFGKALNNTVNFFVKTATKAIPIVILWMNFKITKYENEISIMIKEDCIIAKLLDLMESYKEWHTILSICVLIGFIYFIYKFYQNKQVKMN